MKCCLIALARDEDKFLDEWINYHLNLGFNHIYICDNNDPDKKLNIDNSNVTILDYTYIDFSKSTYGKIRGNEDIQQIIYGEVLSKIYDKFDYCGICDIDEFFDFNGLSLTQFIEKYLTDKYDCVMLHWVNYNDNDIIEHIDKPVQELYTKISTKISNEVLDNQIHHHCVKSIFKLKNDIGSNAQFPIPLSKFYFLKLAREKGYVRHYRTKCLEDYLNHKVKQQNFSNVSVSYGNIIDFYFQINDYTKEKINYINKWIKENNYKLSEKDKNIMKKYNELYNII